MSKNNSIPKKRNSAPATGAAAATPLFSFSAFSSRRRSFDQLSRHVQGTLSSITEIPIGSSSSSSRTSQQVRGSSSGKGAAGFFAFAAVSHVASVASKVVNALTKCQRHCFDRIYRSLLTKYIQLLGLSSRDRIMVAFGIVFFTTLITVDRYTTSTMSQSKWARMMYEDDLLAAAATTSGGGGGLANSGSSNLGGIRGGGSTTTSAAAAASSSSLPAPLGNKIERPRDLHIAFVGDSVTRYMYLDLIYFLKHGRWVQDDDYPNILNAKHFPSWNDHYNFSNLALAPNEQCDCFRNNPKNSSHIDKEETIENRYYADPTLNNYATFIEIFGGFPPHGHWHPHDVYKPHELDFDKLQNDPMVWRQDWPGLIRNYLNKLIPKPDFLVFNEGLWIEHELGNVDVQQSIKDALDDTGIIGIYKTTTLPNINSGLAKRSAGVVFNRHDDAMCEMIGNYLDVSWTKDLGDEHYWDGVHFKPHVNRGMNLELLDFLQRLREGGGGGMNTDPEEDDAQAQEEGEGAKVPDSRTTTLATSEEDITTPMPLREEG